MNKCFIPWPIAVAFLLAITAINQSSTMAQGKFGGFGEFKEPEQLCGEHGTAVTFAKSPAEAAKQALKDEKLVFVLHVSGNFETPDYT